MKVVRLKAPAGVANLRMLEKDPPVPKPGEVLVRLRASSLNPHDDFVVRGVIRVADGRIPLSDGACMPAHAFTRAPAGCSHAQAATLPCAGLTAWRGLVAEVRVRPGDTVLVNGCVQTRRTHRCDRLAVGCHGRSKHPGAVFRTTPREWNSDRQQSRSGRHDPRDPGEWAEAGDRSRLWSRGDHGRIRVLPDAEPLRKDRP
jgi:hypothetical protein